MKTETPKVSIGSKRSESLEQAAARCRREGPRPPLRTIKELADEFGVSVGSLANTLRHSEHGPKPMFRSGGNSLSNLNTWYDPKAVRAWWAARKKDAA